MKNSYIKKAAKFFLEETGYGKKHLLLGWRTSTVSRRRETDGALNTFE
jgi:hypothetical protein